MYYIDSKMRKRILNEADYILAGATIRQTAKYCGTSKSTVSLDMSRLSSIDSSLSKKINRILKRNKLLGQIRGGETTKRRYSKK